MLPPLVVAANLAPTSADNPAWLPRLERLRRFRYLVGAPLAAALLYLAIIGGPHWQTHLAALSPIPDASRALDRELRHRSRRRDTGQFILVRAPTADAVLAREEVLLPALDALIARGTLKSVDAAARLLPSAATQRDRRAALPDPATLAQHLDAALAGLPFRPAAFAPFLAAIATTRTLDPLTPGDLAGTPLAARLEPLLQPTADGWRGLILLHGLDRSAALPPETTYIDLKGELGSVLSTYTAPPGGCSASALCYPRAAHPRSARPRMAARTLAAIAAALLLTIALLTAAGIEISLIHLVALQLVAGVGLDYALFFARRSSMPRSAPAPSARSSPATP